MVSRSIVTMPSTIDDWMTYCCGVYSWAQAFSSCCTDRVPVCYCCQYS